MAAVLIALSHNGLGIYKTHYVGITRDAHRSQVFLQERGCASSQSLDTLRKSSSD